MTNTTKMAWKGKLIANYVTKCGVKFSVTNEMGERIDSVCSFQLRDGEIVQAFLVSVSNTEDSFRRGHNDLRTSV